MKVLGFLAGIAELNCTADGLLSVALVWLRYLNFSGHLFCTMPDKILGIR
jgi:hypothetical protein